MAGLLGYEPEEMVGRPAEDFLFAEDKVDYTRRMEGRQQGRAGNYECRFRRKDGSEIWTLVSATPQMDKAGAFTGSLTMLTDITDRREAEASSKAKSDFLALVSHKIRIPLSALVGFSSLARKTRDPDILQQYLDIIDQSSPSLMDLVNDILEMSKIEAGLLHLESIPFNLVNTIDLIAWQYAPLAKEQCLAAGMQDVLINPIDPDKLAQAISEYCYPPVVVNIPPRVEPIPVNMLSDRIIMDMGYDSAQMQVYLQLLGDDIHAELNRLHRAFNEGDRSLFRAAAHSLKGLCGHLQNPLPMELAQHLHEGALILPYPELRDTVNQLSAVCERLGSKE